jgi:hypothetical protein
MSNANQITFLAVGDISLAREEPERKFDLVLPILKQADFRFGQLEEVLATDYCQQVFAYPRPRTAKPGDPEHAWVLGKKLANFDVLSFASNHTMDWSEKAMQQTIDAIKAEGCQCIGAGWDIEDAIKPAILEKDNTKIGILAYCSVLPKGYAADKGKAGANPLRVNTYYRQFDWQPGTPPEIVDIPFAEDVEAMKEQIKALRKEVDVLMVSMHWGVHFMPAFIADYQTKLGHIAIDAGADVIFGHHAHLVKGVEVYNGKPIFYSLGNFSVADVSLRVIAGDKQNGYFRFKPYRWRPDPEYPDYAFPYESRNAVMLKLTIEDKHISRFALLPLWIGGDNRPEPVKNGDTRFESILGYVKYVCKDQWLDTTFTVDGDEFVVNV